MRVRQSWVALPLVLLACSGGSKTAPDTQPSETAAASCDHGTAACDGVTSLRHTAGAQASASESADEQGDEARDEVQTADAGAEGDDTAEIHDADGGADDTDAGQHGKRAQHADAGAGRGEHGAKGTHSDAGTGKNQASEAG